MDDRVEVWCAYCGEAFAIDLYDAESLRDARCKNPECALPYQFSFHSSLASADAEKQRIQADPGCWASPFLFSASGRETKWVVAYSRESVRRYDPVRLRDLVDEYILRAIEGGFADTVGCPVTIIEVAEDGTFPRIEPLDLDHGIKAKLDWRSYQRPHMRNYSSLCLEARGGTQEQRGETICRDFDRSVVRNILAGRHDIGKPYVCPAGLYDFAYPITVAGRTLAVLFSGQKRLSSSAAEIELSNRLPVFAEATGLSLVEAKELAGGTDLLSQEEMEAFCVQVRKLALKVQSVAERNYETTRTTRDQLFQQEVAARLRKASGDLTSRRSFTQALLQVCRSFVAPYIGLTEVSLLCSFDGDGDCFEREHYGGGDGGSVAIPFQQFSRGARDRDGVIALFGDGKQELLTAVKSVTQDLTAPLFLLRVFLSSKAQLLIVFHGDLNDIPPAYAPVSQNHLARRFYDSLSRVIQADIDQMEDRVSVFESLREREGHMAELAHAVYQPLLGLRLGLERIYRRLEDAGAFGDSITNLLNTARGLYATCVNVLCTMSSRENTGEFFPRDFVRKNLGDIIETAAEVFREEARTKRLRITVTRLDKEPYPDLDMNELLLTTAIQNVVHNAVKYSFSTSDRVERWAEIALLCRRDTGRGGVDGYVVRVKSYGVGIEKHELRRIFERYVRGVRSLDRHRVGSGLGLAQARYAIEEVHGGRIEAYSQPVGKEMHYNVFTIFLPLRQQEGA